MGPSSMGLDGSLGIGINKFEKGLVPSLLTYNTLINGMCER